ncbi:Serine hydroxymethyltransferase 4 [Spatholobus suberectus]|nr:Serine hydroxymethyltransferase 4 [Spatholobus suberectus]
MKWEYKTQVRSRSWRSATTMKRREGSTFVLNLHDRIMGLDLPSDLHHLHILSKPPYKANFTTGYINYDQLEEKALDFRPKMIIYGDSAYPCDWDYKRFKEIAYKCRPLLLYNMAHNSSLVATKEVNNPFEYYDIVTTMRHKSLWGPWASMIFYRKRLKPPKRGNRRMQFMSLRIRLNLSCSLRFRVGHITTRLGPLLWH